MQHANGENPMVDIVVDVLLAILILLTLVPRMLSSLISANIQKMLSVHIPDSYKSLRLTKIDQVRQV